MKKYALGVVGTGLIGGSMAIDLRRRGFAGNALFDLDTTLEKQILPFLRLGLW